MKYIIYKVTNNINKRYYIGQHRTKNINDNYMGSGKIVKEAIKKYGKENFTKEILYVFDNFEEMNNKEREIVTEEFINKSETYNIELGGNNAPLIEETKRKISKALKGRKLADNHKKNIALKQGIYKRTEKHRDEISERLKGKKMSEETKKKISKNSASAKPFEIWKNDKIIYTGYNLVKYCKDNNYPEPTFRASHRKNMAISGRTESTKQFKGWLIKIKENKNDI